MEKNRNGCFAKTFIKYILGERNLCILQKKWNTKHEVIYMESVWNSEVEF